jgi:two-component system chemotaxis sensor kinase CheA
MEDLEQRLRALFLEDLQDGLRALRDGISDLQPPGGAGRIEVQRELFRVAHSLKGAGHSANAPAAVSICHRLEDVFARVQSGQRAVDASLLAEVTAAVDELAVVEDQLRRGSGSGGAAPAPTTPVPAPVTAAPAEGGAAAPLPGPRLRIAVSTADELVAQVTELVDALSHAGVSDRGVSQAASRLVESSHGLRLQSFADACAGLDRAAAEVAATAGKQVALVVEGGETRVDRSVAAALREPLLHLVRNAVDHGIELPQARRAAGKGTTGTVRVSATVVDGTVEVTVSDDGAGVDGQALQEAAARRGVAADEDELELAFTAGVSTAAEVTVVSGRGVGLDAVRDRIERLGGGVHLSSFPDRGTEVVCTVPATLATVQVLLVGAGGESVALSVAALDRVEQVELSALRDVGGRRVLLGGEPITVVPLAGALGLDEPPLPPSGSAVVVRLTAAAGGGALQVDAVDDETEGVLRPLPERLQGLPGVLGLLGLPGTGLAPVLNPASCVRWGMAQLRPATAPAAAADAAAGARVLLVEDTLTTRVLEQSILETAGYDVVTAADGAQAWELLQAQPVDLVVSDVDMPNVTGIELCRMIRGSGQFPDLPVVLVTSLGSDDDRRRGAEAGADAYLVKSAFDRQALLEAVGRLL